MQSSTVGTAHPTSVCNWIDNSESIGILQCIIACIASLSRNKKEPQKNYTFQHCYGKHFQQWNCRSIFHFQYQDIDELGIRYL